MLNMTNKEELLLLKEMMEELDDMYLNWLKQSGFDSSNEFTDKYRKIDKFSIEEDFVNGYEIFLYGFINGRFEQIGAAFKTDENADMDLFMNQAVSLIFKIASELDTRNSEINDNGSWNNNHFRSRAKKWGKKVLGEPQMELF